MLERLPDQYKTPATARALTLPSAILLGGAGASVAILAGAPLAFAALVGAAGWAARVAVALPRRAKAERINPAQLKDPWRTFVRNAISARDRFERAVEDTRPGPLRSRLSETAARVAVGTTECWRIAKTANAFELAVRELDADGIRAELTACEVEAHQSPDSTELQATAAALRRQLESALRLQRVVDDARNHLRRLEAQLDESVARAIELSLGAHDASQLEPLGSTVNGVVDELESLRQALDEEIRPG